MKEWVTNILQLKIIMDKISTHDLGFKLWFSWNLKSIGVKYQLKELSSNAEKCIVDRQLPEFWAYSLMISTWD